MAYKVLEKQINALPLEAQREVAHYVSFLFSIYNKKKENKSDIRERINAFMAENPNAFDEFRPMHDVGLESIRELTKNDTW